jgi:hypothetical protein
LGFGLPCLRDFAVNPSEFEERSIISEPDDVPNQLYRMVGKSLRGLWLFQIKWPNWEWL